MTEISIRWSPTTYRDFKKCNRMIYYKKVLNLEGQDSEYDMYGDAGTASHKALQKYYESGRNLNTSHLEFNQEWEKFKIGNKLNKEEFWKGILWTIDLNLIPTSCEFNVLFEIPYKYVTYIDAINSQQDWIANYKSSTYKSSKIFDGREQLLSEAVGFRHKFKRNPQKAYLIFTKAQKIFEFEFSEEMISRREEELKEVSIFVEKLIKNEEWKITENSKDCFWCRFKEICKKDPFGIGQFEIQTLNFTIIIKGNELFLEGPITNLLTKGLQKELNYKIKDAFFIQKALRKKGRFWDGTVELWNTRYNKTTIGFINRLINVLKMYGNYVKKQTVIEIRDKRDVVVLNTILHEYSEKLNFDGLLYEHQIKAIELAMKEKIGIIESPTGSGKTLIAAEILRKIQGKALFVIDNKDLLFQTVQKYEELLGPIIGIVGAGMKPDWTKPITCATIQTLVKNLHSYIKQLEKINVVIFDETQIIAADSFRKLCKYLPNTKYRIGTSATPYRDDKNDKLIEANCGSVIYKVGVTEMIEKKVLVKPKAIFLDMKAVPVPGEDYHTEYLELIETNEIRNEIIQKVVRKFEGSKILILAKHINHCKRLQLLFPGSSLIYGETENELRKDILSVFKNGNLNILIGNIKIFNKGIDIPSLKVLINATGNKAQVITIQAIGRALRIAPGKTEATYIDFYDKGQYMSGASKSRFKALSDFGYDVKLVDLTDFFEEKNI